MPPSQSPCRRQVLSSSPCSCPLQNVHAWLICNVHTAPSTSPGLAAPCCNHMCQTPHQSAICACAAAGAADLGLRRAAEEEAAARMAGQRGHAGEHCGRAGRGRRAVRAGSALGHAGIEAASKRFLCIWAHVVHSGTISLKNRLCGTLATLYSGKHCIWPDAATAVLCARAVVYPTQALRQPANASLGNRG